MPPKGLIGLHEHGVQKGGDKADTGCRKSLGQVQGSGLCTKNNSYCRLKQRTT